MQSRASGLGMLVQIVVLDLAEIPVVGVHNGPEGVGVAVIGKADLADLTGGLFFGDPVLDAQRAQAGPGPVVGEHVHQIIVHMVGAQTAQLLEEDLFHALPAFDHVVRELCGDVDPVPHTAALEDLAHGGFAAGVDIGGVKIVHACVDRREQLRFGFLQVDAPGLLGEAHTPVA